MLAKCRIKDYYKPFRYKIHISLINSALKLERSAIRHSVSLSIHAQYNIWSNSSDVPLLDEFVPKQHVANVPCNSSHLASGFPNACSNIF